MATIWEPQGHTQRKKWCSRCGENMPSDTEDHSQNEKRQATVMVTILHFRENENHLVKRNKIYRWQKPKNLNRI